MGSDQAAVSGILNVDKPYGLTSMEVVRRVKRGTGLRRVGHGGTLDPVATGVIPVCLGRATRVMEYLVAGTKEYRTVIELGITTDTYDALGEVTEQADASTVTAADIERSLEPFKGVIDQVPPMYSALKRQGKRLYDLARSGIHVEREPRKVESSRVDLVEWSYPLATVEVTCGRGFYMRSLAHDLGQALGCGAHLRELTRLRSGPFHLAGATGLEELEQMIDEGTWQDVMFAPDSAVQGLPSVIIGKNPEQMIKHGRPLAAGVGILTSGKAERCRTYSVDGRFIGVLAFDSTTGQWRPHKVFSA